ncbi:MAG: Kdo2-lipid lauroyltransferase/acyltransferase [Verrucomicrobiota bacterium]
MPSPWKKFRYRFEWLALAALAKLIPLLSRKACARCARIFGALAATFDRHGRRVALSNLEAAFGDRFSPTQRSTIVRESYQNFARTMLDLFWAPRLTRENFLRYIDIEDLERFKKEIAPSGSCIFACLHYGNFEWVSLGMGFAGFPSGITAQEFKNSRIDPIFNSLRTVSGHHIVPREGAMLRLFKDLKRKGRIALLIDLSLVAERTAVVIDLFGLKTSTTFAHAWLHERTGSPIIPIYAESQPDGRCRVFIQSKLEVAPNATNQQVAQACWDRFEPIIRENPSAWLWSYKHWRYRPAATPRAYPFYSQFSQDFQALIQSGGENSASVAEE